MSASPCEQWLADRLGGQDPTSADLQALLLAGDAAPPDPACRLRAVYLAADQAPPMAEALYLQGRAEALALLQKSPAFAGADLGDVEDMLAQAAAEDVPALFWTGYFWGHLLKFMNPLSAGSQRGDVLAILARVLELDPAYYAGAADTWLGAYYASLPRFFGRDYKKAGAHFQRGLANAAGHYGRRWTFAQVYLAGRENEAFLREITRIAEVPAPVPGSAWYVENTIARKDARDALHLK